MKLGQGAALPESSRVDRSVIAVFFSARFVEYFVVIAGAAIAIGLFFRVPFASGMNLLFSDRYDGAIETALLEHWYNVLSAGESWGTVQYFYPYHGTLAYNDGYFLYGLIFAAARALGADPYLGAECVNIVVKLIGYAGFLACAATLGLGLPAAVFGALLFTIASGSYVQASHVQLFSVGFAPVLAVLLFRFGRALSRGGTGAAAAWGVAASALYCSWLMTSFYMAYYFTLYAGAAALVLAVAYRASLVADGRQMLRRTWPALAATLVVLAAGLAPFLALYLPKAAETGMHPFSGVLLYSPTVIDVFHVGLDNFVWGGLDVALNHYLRPHLPGSDEHATGITPVLLLFFAIGVWVLCIRPGTRLRNAALTRILLWAMAVAAVLTWVLVLRIGYYTLWRFAYLYLPGAKAIRVLSRYQLLLLWPVITIGMAGLCSIARSLSPARRVALLAVLLPLLVAEQIASPGPIKVNRPLEMARLQALPPPPQSCTSFLATRNRPPDFTSTDVTEALYSHNTDAMLIAEYLHLPTVNGFSTFTPPGYDFSSASQPDYIDRARRYAEAHGIAQGLCGLDLTALSWDTDPLNHR